MYHLFFFYCSNTHCLALRITKTLNHHKILKKKTFLALWPGSSNPEHVFHGTHSTLLVKLWLWIYIWPKLISYKVKNVLASIKSKVGTVDYIVAQIYFQWLILTQYNIKVLDCAKDDFVELTWLCSNNPK